jgi:hypothetical protein
MSLNTTDFDVIERFQSIMGGNIHIERKRRPEQKQQWKWTLYGYDVARRVLDLWRPWLGQRRIGQFERALAECDAVRESFSS